jgi:putative aminopeptidase FrvX
MNSDTRQFLDRLLHSPGPSGYEQRIQSVVRDFVQPFADDVTTDWHGNVVACVNPEGSPRIMLAGHCDQIGLMVKHVDETGFIRVSPIGGWDVQMLLGQHVQIWTKSEPVSGVIARKAIHLLTLDERKKVPAINDLWIDIGVQSEAEARELVEIGDPVTLVPGYRELRNGLIAGSAMDDRVGVWVVMRALQRIRQGNPKAAVFSVSTVQEEIGLRGAQTSAFSIDPQLGIAVDVTHATDCPTIDKNEHGDIRIGNGPVIVRGPNVNPVVFRSLMDLADDKKIPVQVNGLAKPAGNDGNAMQLVRGGLAIGLVTIPNRYMHSPVEVVSLTDLEQAAELIAEFCLSLDENSDFTPHTTM